MDPFYFAVVVLGYFLWHQEENCLLIHFASGVEKLASVEPVHFDEVSETTRCELVLQAMLLTAIGFAECTWCQDGYTTTSLERVSIECRKTKTKVITLANQKGRRQSSKPIKTRSNYTQPTRSAGKCARASHDWF